MAAAGDGIGAGMPTEGSGRGDQGSGTGQGGRREGRPGQRTGGGTAGDIGGGPGWVVGVEKVKDYLRTAFIGVFLCAFKLILHHCRFCTDGGGCPVVVVMLEGWQAAAQLGGAIPPPLMIYEGTISGFSLQKFFFGFRVALRLCRLAKLLAYVVECVQINKEWDGKLFVLYCGVNGLNGFNGFKG